VVVDIFSKLAFMEPAKKKVYIETTIPSVITAKPSRDIRNLWLPELVTPDLLMDIEKEEVQNGRV
jgi:hypothetical protein